MISRLLVLSVLLVIDVSGLNAQVVRSFGIKAGLTVSNIRSPDFENEGLSFSFDEDRRRGLLIMAFVEWIESGTLSIITEAGYIPRGNEFELSSATRADNEQGFEPAITRFVRRFDYISVAVPIKARINGGNVVPYAMAGPRVDFLLDGEPETILVESYRSTAFGIVMGVGIENASSISIFGELRYNTDFTNSLPDAPRDAYNNAFDLIIGLRF